MKDRGSTKRGEYEVEIDGSRSFSPMRTIAGVNNIGWHEMETCVRLVLPLKIWIYIDSIRRLVIIYVDKKKYFEATLMFCFEGEPRRIKH